MATKGVRSVESTDAIANAPYTTYGLGQLIVDLTTLKVYVRGVAGWTLLGEQTVVLEDETLAAKGGKSAKK